MKPDFGDLLTFFGASMTLAGLYLFDWRYALIAAGVMLMILGLARLRIKSYKRT